ncbi:MAG: hypothetical protein ACREP9_03550 [Candidatus Dormibacteraceae bacterium]
MVVETRRRLGLGKLGVAVVVVSLAATVSVAAFSAGQQQVTVSCRVMEVMASSQFHVRLVIFHYRDAADRSRLGELLRQYNGRPVQFRPQDGVWQNATVLRMRTCFGRGLLVFAASEPQLTEKQEFQLRFLESGRK